MVENRSRTPSGQPTGGQFATEAKGTATGVTLGEPKMEPAAAEMMAALGPDAQYAPSATGGPWAVSVPTGYREAVEIEPWGSNYTVTGRAWDATNGLTSEEEIGGTHRTPADAVAAARVAIDERRQADAEVERFLDAEFTDADDEVNSRHAAALREEFDNRDAADQQEFEDQRRYQQWRDDRLADDPDLTEDEVSQEAFADEEVARWEAIHDAD